MKGAVLVFQQLNRCLFCFSKLSLKSLKEKKILSVTEFNEVWNHLVPEEETEFSEPPPVCLSCGNTLEKLYSALVQLTEATIVIRNVISESGRSGSYYKERFSKLVEDLREITLEDACRRDALSLLQKLGHEEVFEEDYQAWFSPNECKADLKQEVEIVVDSDAASDCDASPPNDGIQDSEGGSIPQKQTTEQESTPRKRLKTLRRRKGSNTSIQNKCDFCGEKVTLDKINEHVRNHVGDFAFYCPNPVCKRAFGTISGIMIHRRRTIKRCQRFFTRSFYSCDICGHQSCNSRKLLQHLTASHETDEKSFSCPVSPCSERYTTRQAVQCHIHCHASRKVKKAESSDGPPADANISCRYCPVLFTSWEKLVDHMLVHMTPGNAVTCSLCSPDCVTEYRKISDLKNHCWEKHQIGTPYICHLCPYVCWSPSGLQYHRKFIHGPKVKKPTKKRRKYRNLSKCNKCPKEFRYTNDLVAHKIKIHGEPRLECDICGEKFIYPGDFNRHKRAHLGIVKRHAWGARRPVEPLVCSQCGDKFEGENRLRVHVKQAHSGRNFECQVCGRRYKTDAALKKHQQTRLCKNAAMGLVSRETMRKYDLHRSDPSKDSPLVEEKD